MAKNTPRAILSRQQRAERVEAGRRELTVFLSRLDPLLRKSLLQPESITLDEARKVYAQPDRERQYQAAVTEYERLLIHIPDQWRQYRRRLVSGFAVVKEWILLKQIRRRGAPKKRDDDREDAIVARTVQETQQRLTKGCEIRRERKTAGGSASDDDSITDELKALGLSSDDVDAILKSRTPQGAAARWVARKTNKTVASVKVSVSRARRRASAHPEKIR
jgi:hypothetical protein